MVEVFHSLIKVKTQNSQHLNDPATLEKFVEQVSEILETHIVELSSHSFLPSGYTSYAILQESHAAIHTWPEENYFVLDILSCKKFPDAFKIRLENLVKSTFSINSISFED